MSGDVFASLILPLDVVDVATFWISLPHYIFVFFGSIVVDIGGNACQPHIGFSKFVTILSCVVKNCVHRCQLCSSFHLWSYYAFLLLASLGLCGGVRKNFDFDFEFSSSSSSSSIQVRFEVSHTSLFIFKKIGCFNAMIFLLLRHGDTIQLLFSCTLPSHKKNG